MPDDPDVLVVGGGVAGLFCAYHLRERGLTVTVVERGAVGDRRSCSHGNTGFVGTQGAAPLAEPSLGGLGGWRRLLDPAGPLQVHPRPDPDLLRWLRLFRRACTPEAYRDGFRALLGMKRRSLAVLHDLQAKGELDGAFAATGLVLAYRTPEGFEAAVRALPAATEGGVPLRALEPGELAALEPDTEFTVAGALHNDEGAYVRSPDLVRALAGTLTAAGVEIREGTEVRDFVVAGGHVARVRTSRGDVRPQEVVLAAGSWTPACARRLGLRLPLQPARGCTVTVAAPAGAPRRPVLLGEGRVAVAPLGDRVRFGGTLELAGMAERVSGSRVAGVLRTVRSYLPGFADPQVLETWSGLRPCTPDGLPYVGRAARFRNVSVACGHGNMGMGLAPDGGRLLADLLTGSEPGTDPAPFRVDRFGGRS